MPEQPAALRSQRSPMKVEFLGVLAQAQKKAHQTSGVMQAIQIATGIAQIAQAVPQAAESFDYVDFAQLLKNGFEAGGASQLVIREDDDVQKIRAERAQAQEQAAAAEAALRQEQVVAQNYNKLNEPVKPGTPLAALAGHGGQR
jgi:carbamoylphosphate synthase large subunit